MSTPPLAEGVAMATIFRGLAPFRLAGIVRARLIVLRPRVAFPIPNAVFL